MSVPLHREKTLSFAATIAGRSFKETLMYRFHAFVLLTLTGLLQLPCASACDLQIKDGWIPEAPPAAPTLAVYGNLKNVGSGALTIRAISTVVAERAMLHETTVMGGVAKMRMIATLTIPPRAEMLLFPGGKHLMLTRLKEQPKPGERVMIAFTDSVGCVTQGDFVVRSITSNR